jgi:hypothetical protein
MLAVAAPAETLASAFEMTRASKGHAVDLTRVAGAFEFMDASRQERRIRGPRNTAALRPSLEAIPYFASGLQRLVLLQERRAD